MLFKGYIKISFLALYALLASSFNRSLLVDMKLYYLFILKDKFNADSIKMFSRIPSVVPFKKCEIE